jgi:hypothetical protein
MARSFDDAGAIRRPQGWRDRYVLRNLLARLDRSPCSTESPAQVSRPGAVLEFQFPKYTDSDEGVKIESARRQRAAPTPSPTREVRHGC